MDRDRYGGYRVNIMTYSRTWGPVLILLLEMANGPWVVSDIGSISFSAILLEVPNVDRL